MMNSCKGFSLKGFSMQYFPSTELSKLGLNDWITKLQDYYLRSDGPYGNTPITSLDVTPAGLVTRIKAEWNF